MSFFFIKKIFQHEKPHYQAIQIFMALLKLFSTEYSEIITIKTHLTRNFPRDNWLPVPKHQILITNQNAVNDDGIQYFIRAGFSLVEMPPYFEGGNCLLLNGRVRTCLFLGEYTQKSIFEFGKEILPIDLALKYKLIEKNIYGLDLHVLRMNEYFRECIRIISFSSTSSFSSYEENFFMFEELTKADGISIEAVNTLLSNEVKKNPNKFLAHGNGWYFEVFEDGRSICFLHEDSPYKKYLEALNRYYYHLDCFMCEIDGNVIILNSEILSQESVELLVKSLPFGKRLIDLKYNDYINKPCMMNLLPIKLEQGGYIIYSSDLPQEVVLSLQKNGFLIVTPASICENKELKIKLSSISNNLNFSSSFDWEYFFGGLHCLTLELKSSYDFILGHGGPTFFRPIRMQNETIMEVDHPKIKRESLMVSDPSTLFFTY